MPNGAASNGTSFSSRRAARGRSRSPRSSPSRSAAISAWRSSSVRSGGFIFRFGSSVRTASSVSERWCGVTSPLACAPRRRARRAARPTRGPRGAGGAAARRCRGERELARDVELSPSDGQPPSPSRPRRPPVHEAAARQRRLLARAARARRPVIAWYCSARRIRPAVATGRPSSVKPTAPASAQLAHLGQLARPAGRRVIAARSRPGRAPRARRAPAGRSTAGGVDDRRGVRHRDDRAVAAGRRRGGARVDRLLVLLAGRAQVDVRVDERREHVLPAASTTSVPLGGSSVRRCRARRSSPSRTRTSWSPSSPSLGSSTWAPRTTRLVGPAPADEDQRDRARRRRPRQPGAAVSRS